jgi:hypothetical protein
MRKVISINLLLGFALTLAVAGDLNSAEQASASTNPKNSPKEAQEVKGCQDLSDTVWPITVYFDDAKNMDKRNGAITFNGGSMMSIGGIKELGDRRPAFQYYKVMDDWGMCRLQAIDGNNEVTIYYHANWAGKIMIGTINVFEGSQLWKRMRFTSVNEVRQLEVPPKTPAAVPERSQK